jgi:hypothetical protein
VEEEGDGDVAPAGQEARATAGRYGVEAASGLISSLRPRMMIAGSDFARLDGGSGISFAPRGALRIGRATWGFATLHPRLRNLRRCAARCGLRTGGLALTEHEYSRNAGFTRGGGQSRKLETVSDFPGRADPSLAFQAPLTWERCWPYSEPNSSVLQT